MVFTFLLFFVPGCLPGYGPVNFGPDVYWSEMKRPLRAGEARHGEVCGERLLAALAGAAAIAAGQISLLGRAVGIPTVPIAAAEDGAKETHIDPFAMMVPGVRSFQLCRPAPSSRCC